MNKDFLSGDAVKLSRNPLGIIALFVVFTYLMSSIIILNAEKLTKDQRGYLVWFLIIFPIIVFTGFVYLVRNHHKKLYAPMDFRDEKNFFGFEVEDLTVSDKDVLIKQNVETIKEELAEVQTSPFLTSSNKEKEIFNLNIQDSKEHLLIREAYRAEALAIKYLENREGLSIRKNVRLSPEKTNQHFVCDGIYRDKKGVTNIVEVKLTNGTSGALSRMRPFFEHFFIFQNQSQEILKLKIILVLKENSLSDVELFKSKIIENLATSYGKAFSETVELIVLSMEVLKRTDGAYQS